MNSIVLIHTYKFSGPPSLSTFFLYIPPSLSLSVSSYSPLPLPSPNTHVPNTDSTFVKHMLMKAWRNWWICFWASQITSHVPQCLASHVPFAPSPLLKFSLPACTKLVNSTWVILLLPCLTLIYTESESQISKYLWGYFLNVLHSSRLLLPLCLPDQLWSQVAPWYFSLKQ